MPRPDKIPLSFAQQRLWFLDQLEPGSTAYLVSNAYRLHGSIEEPCLQRSLHALIARHESLRTTFVEQAGQPIQVVHQADDAPLPVIDLQALQPVHRDEQVQGLARQAPRA